MHRDRWPARARAGAPNPRASLSAASNFVPRQGGSDDPPASVGVEPGSSVPAAGSGLVGGSRRLEQDDAAAAQSRVQVLHTRATVSGAGGVQEAPSLKRQDG